ncbi:MAG: hypothetical protein CMC70_00855 [Flavobacteriaceae bacterium]|nr:hypothetical protein [Flavobacteriaceae bacterium]|tara:strand:- start:311 stop:862 length:552 start_codon:yes stop_codon:yes gene_type:complete
MKLSTKQEVELIKTLQARFEANKNRHKKISWVPVEEKLKAHPEKIVSLFKMEETGGEPDVVAYNNKTDTYLFYDCVSESPKGRRSLCYDRKALESRKAHKPKNTAKDMAKEIGVELLTETDYQYLQNLGCFDTKTSSWLETPIEIRKLGGAVFGDLRFGRVFIYHNGAQSYYAGRGFRGKVSI